MERAESFVDACIQEGSTEMIPVVSAIPIVRFGAAMRTTAKSLGMAACIPIGSSVDYLARHFHARCSLRRREQAQPTIS